MKDDFEIWQFEVCTEKKKTDKQDNQKHVGFNSMN